MTGRKKWARLIPVALKGKVQWRAVCKEHDKWWTSAGAAGQGTYQGVRAAAAAHDREHRQEGR